MAKKVIYRLGFGEKDCFLAKIENSVITEKSEIHISYEVWIMVFEKIMEEEPKLSPKDIIFKAVKKLGFTPMTNSGNTKYEYNYNNAEFYKMLKEYLMEVKKDEMEEERRRHKEYVEGKREFFEGYVKIPNMYNNPRF